MTENIPEETTENIEPQEVKLKVPELSETSEMPETENTWLVVAKNRRVNRDWEALMQRYPENTRRCYNDLRTVPTTRQPRRVFPLKGKKYKGVWEYEVTGGDRVFYIPDENQLKVVVFLCRKTHSTRTNPLKNGRSRLDWPRQSESRPPAPAQYSY